MNFLVAVACAPATPLFLRLFEFRLIQAMESDRIPLDGAVRESQTMALWELLDSVVEGLNDPSNRSTPFDIKDFPPGCATDLEMLTSVCDGDTEMGILLCVTQWLEACAAEDCGFPVDFTGKIVAGNEPDASLRKRGLGVTTAQSELDLLAYVWKVSLHRPAHIVFYF